MKAAGRRPHPFRSTVLLAIGFAIAVAILLSPTFLESVNNIRQTTEIGTYEDSLSGLDTEQMLKEAAAYNRSIERQQKTSAFSYRGEEATDRTYEHVLSADREKGGGAMAFLEIRKIHLYLPVMHGTREKDLTSSVGHMYGTSVPVGGEDTHAVLAAHTGLKSADLFTNLTRMRTGDTFRVHVLGRVLIYTVDQIEIVYPDEEDPYLQVVDGKDYVTLYTCTPYGVNDHRLLVRGVRTGTETEPAADAARATTSLNRLAVVRTALLGAVPFLIILAGVLKARHDRRKTARKAAERAARAHRREGVPAAPGPVQANPAGAAEDAPGPASREHPDLRETADTAHRSPEMAEDMENGTDAKKIHDPDVSTEKI